MQFNHPTGYQSNLLYLLCVLGKKMVAIQLLLLQTVCLIHVSFMLAFMSMLIDHLKHIREFNRYVVFSDGAPTQFKQKLTMCGMTYFSSLSVGISLPQVTGKGQ